MFYDLEDPSKFIKDAAESLDDDGIFVAQLMCSQSMFKMNDLGNICHEHLEYYSYDSLKYLFEKNGLKIFKISEIKGLLEPSVQGWYSPEYNIYAPNSVTEFSTNIDQEQHFLWLIVPESEDSSALSIDKIKIHEDHFKIEFTFNGQLFFPSFKVTITDTDVELTET